MKHLLTPIFILITLSLFVQSCHDDDNFSSDPNLSIGFSQESIVFDTVFTSVTSPYQVLKIYNNNDKSISLSSVRIANPDQSGFRFNVNGSAGTELHDVDLYKNDSIFIWVDINAKKQSSSTVTDYIEVSWNGNTNRLPLSAEVIDVEVWDNKTIGGLLTLEANSNYYIKGRVDVPEGAQLDIKEGVTLYFDQKGTLDIAGTVTMHGTAERRITLRGHRFDYIQKGVRYDNASGQWQGITVRGNSYNNIFENVNIRNSVVGVNFLQSSADQKKATFKNSIIHNTSKLGLQAVSCDIEAVNCQFTNSGGSLLYLIGGKSNFLHCTVANYYEWDNARSASSVVLSEVLSGASYPFIECRFTNSIIVGLFYDELDVFVQSNPSSILFNTCLIQSSRVLENPIYKDTKWNIQSAFLFKDLSYKGDFNYSFELIEGSAAIHSANRQEALIAPTDLRGIDRLVNVMPDIGCYQYFYTGQ